MKPVIEFDHVTVGYRKDAPILNDVSFSIPEGEMVGLIGPNGSGKTTLLRALAGLLRPAAGRVLVAGTDVTAMSATERSRMLATVPQELALPVAFTVEELVMIGRTAFLGRFAAPSSVDIEHVERALLYTDMIELRHRSVFELSGGEKQRAAMATSLAQASSIILLDEVTSHLDLKHRLEIMQIVERLNREQNVTVVLSSHDLNIAAEFCARLLLLDHGSLVADGTPAEVLTPRLLRRVYSCDVRVEQNPSTGALTIFPARRLTPDSGASRAPIHVVGGGGSARALLRHLCFRGHAVTVGVLNEGDSDTHAASALGIRSSLERPFSPISQESLDRALALSAEAETVVVSDVHFGPGNVVNLQIAERALDRGCRVILATSSLAERDHTPSREAEARINLMLERGALPAPTVAEIIHILEAAANVRHL